MLRLDRHARSRETNNLSTRSLAIWIARDAVVCGNLFAVSAFCTLVQSLFALNNFTHTTNLKSNNNRL